MADFIHKKSHPIICRLEARVIEGGIFLAANNELNCISANGSHGPYLGKKWGYEILTAARDLIRGKLPGFPDFPLE